MTEIPIRTAKGPEEVTVWLWPHAPKPVVLTVSREKWEKIEAAAEEKQDGSVAKYIAQLIEKELSESRP